jgi:hypothetical protein
LRRRALGRRQKVTTRGERMLVRPSTTWYDLEPEVVPAFRVGLLGFPAFWYGWYDLLLSLAHTRGERGISGFFLRYEGSGQKVVLSVLELCKWLVVELFQWYDLNFEVVPGRTKGDTA